MRLSAIGIDGKGTRGLIPAVNSKGLTVFFIGDRNKEEHHHDGPLCHV